MKLSKSPEPPNPTKPSNSVELNHLFRRIDKMEYKIQDLTNGQNHYSAQAKSIKEGINRVNEIMIMMRNKQTQDYYWQVGLILFTNVIFFFWFMALSWHVYVIKRM